MAQYHADTSGKDTRTSSDIARPAPIVSADGRSFESIYLSLFYIDDPTLVVPIGMFESPLVGSDSSLADWVCECDCLV